MIKKVEEKRRKYIRNKQLRFTNRVKSEEDKFQQFANSIIYIVIREIRKWED